MKASISKAEELNGILLSQGYTQKEVANIRSKSTRTISNQVDRFYKKTGCRNLADMTRFMVHRYTRVPVEDVLLNALHDLSLVIAGAALFYIFSQPSNQTEILGAFDSLFSAIRDQLHGWFAKPQGAF
jgi:hypothetical protein